MALGDGQVARTTATIPTPYTIDDAVTWLEAVVRPDRLRAGWREWGVDHDGELVGVVALQVIGDQRANISYWISPSRWGQGMATFAASEAVRRAAALGVAAVQGRCLAGNLRSARVLEKAGFRFVAMSEGPWRGDGVREFRNYVIDLEAPGVPSSH